MTATVLRTPWRHFALIRSHLLVAALLCVAALGFSSCDGAIESAYDEQLVLGGFLYANAPIDSVILHRTTPFGAYYDDLSYAVDSATVTITVDGVTHSLLPGARKGRYYLPASELIVQGGKTYAIEVHAPNRQTGGTHVLRSETTVPMPIHFTGISDSLRGRTIVFDTAQLSSFQFVMTAGPIDEPNRKYMLGVTPLDTTQGRIPVIRQGPPVDSLAPTRYSFVQSGPVIGVSPRLFGWYGPNRISFLAIDTNWVDYQRQVLAGNTSYQPSLNHVEGGMGIFGSAGRDTMTIYLKPKE